MIALVVFFLTRGDDGTPLTKVTLGAVGAPDPYWETFKTVARDEDITPIGSTAIYPLALYSSQVDDIADIAEGDTVVVPDDDSNQARGLNISQSAGLITLKDDGSTFSDLADVDTASSKVKVRAIKGGPDGHVAA